MIKKEMVEVENIYCNICNKKITNSTIYRFTLPDGTKAHSCDGYGEIGYRFAWEMPENLKAVNPQTCEDKLKESIITGTFHKYI